MYFGISAKNWRFATSSVKTEHNPILIRNLLSQIRFKLALFRLMSSRPTNCYIKAVQNFDISPIAMQN